VVLGGDSAGAQIAAWYAEATHDGGLRSATAIDDCLPADQLRGLLLFYGVYDFDTARRAPFPFIGTYTRSFLGADEHTFAENAVLASPGKHVTANLPPVFLCAGQRDGLYSQTVDFAELLQQNGIDCRTLLFPRTHRAGHGFLFFRWLKSSKLAFAEVREFLRDL
jgi:acetyl esterase/lipase